MTTDHAEYAVTQAVGLPETRLPYQLLATLPGSAPAAPWQTRCEVISWLHPLRPQALPAFPEPIRPSGSATIAWALVRYTDTPVGPYSEIAATLIPDDGDGYGHIPFIAVDSLASIVGGRANWLLPKTLASFAWSDDHRTVQISGSQPDAPAWSISVSCSPTGEASPTALTNRVQQVAIDGVVRRFEGEAKGALQSAAVDVTGQSEGPLALLLEPGHHEGSLLCDADFMVDALAPV